MSSSSSATVREDLFQPTEMSQEEYQDLLQQIRNELTIPDCQDELMDAARYNDIDVVRAILQVHPQLPMPVDNKEKGGNTPLHMYVRHSCLGTFVSLQPKQNNSHFPIFHFIRAAANGHVGVMELLLATGVVDPSITNSAGNTALVSGERERARYSCDWFF
jgi:ankyrin repeat protein